MISTPHEPNQRSSRGAIPFPVMAAVCIAIASLSFPAAAQPTSPETSVDMAVAAQMPASVVDTSTVSLRDFIISLLDDRDRAVTAALEAINQRFTGVNEFRAQLSDQAKTFATRDQIDAFAVRLNEASARADGLINRMTVIESSISPADRQIQIDMQALTQRVTSIEQKSIGQNQAWDVGVAIAGLLFGVVATWGFLRTRSGGTRI